MRKCKCGRTLKPGEKICPACALDKDYKLKKTIEIFAGAAFGTVLLMLRFHRKK